MKANGRISESSCLFEPLEARLLLSMSLSTPSFDLRLGNAEQISLVDNLASLQHQTNESQISTYDAGDYYWYFDEKMPLLRVGNEVVVSLKPSSNIDQIVNQLTEPGGVLAGFQKDRALSDNTLSFVNLTTDGLNLEEIFGVLVTCPEVEWVSPTFFSERTGTRVWGTDEIVVALEDGVDPVIFFGTDFTDYRRLFMNQYVATVAVGSLTALETANQLYSSPEVVWTSPNFYADIRASTNDPLYGDQWHLNNTGQTGAQSDADVDAPEAWTTTTGSDEIVIAILDNGVQTSHPDLNDHIFVNTGEIPANGNDDDDNGYEDDVNGWDFADDDNDPNPATQYDNHGTAVAGVAAAEGGRDIVKSCG
ncbi:MAG: S8 family serine peptidase [Chloroflexota bacterium]|nr:S8 family serine peptidase [Chloroflexota bacterium]